MKNSEIINAVFERDKSNTLLSQINQYGSLRKQGYSHFGFLENVAPLYDVLFKLDDANYQISEQDAKILRKYNVLVSPLNMSSGFCDNDNSFVVTSDFHGYSYPLEKIKNHYLNEYNVIYILGDATDRGADEVGTGSVKLLLDIMNLSKQYPGRVIYVPGNHDEFLLGYVRSKKHMDSYYPYSYLANLLYNGGEATVKELNELEKNNPREFNELISWLARQPLQRVHKYNGKTYVLGHALFNQKLYDIKPDYCLDDFFKESEYSDRRRMAKDVLWFRKDKDCYNTYEMPSSDKIMVIGHTTARHTRGKNLDLCDGAGNTIKVHCVDGGIAYGGGMLKYDGGSNVFWTTMVHNNSSNISVSSQALGDKETIFQDYILGKVLKEGSLGMRQVIYGARPKELLNQDVGKIVCGGDYDLAPQDVEFMRNLYVKTFLFDYILECQYERMEERYGRSNALMAVSTSVERFLHGSKDYRYIRQCGSGNSGNYRNFTSYRNARDIAIAMGPQAMEDVLKVHGCTTVDEYVIRKLSTNTKGKSYTKI